MLMLYRPITNTSFAKYRKRIESVNSTARSKSGSLSAADMFAHLRTSLECMFDSLAQKNGNSRTIHLLCPMMFCSSQWLEKHSAEDHHVDEVGDAEVERLRLIELMQRFVDELQQHPNAVVINSETSPATLKWWANVQGRHFEHHLRQFGV